MSLRFKTHSYLCCALFGFTLLFLFPAFGNADQNHYEVLGVSPNASVSEIRATYRRLAMQLHPDRTGGDVEKAERFKAVKEAYEVLSNEQRRREFDRQLRNKFSPPPRETQRPPHPENANLSVEDRLIVELESAGPVSMRELIVIGMRFLNAEININKGMSGPELHAAAETLFRVWARAGRRTSRLLIMETSFKIAFLYLQRLRPLSPDLYEHYYNRGFQLLLQNYKQSQTFSEYVSRLYNVLNFARELNQSQAACGEYLKTGTDSYRTAGNRVDYSI